MKLTSMFLGAGILAAATTGAYAENLTSRVLDWNPVDQIITFADGIEMSLQEDLAPTGLKSGDDVAIVFEGSGVEGVMDAVHEITIMDRSQEVPDAERYGYGPF
jgi:hypothetical protein